jgi:hypothetical protein
LAVGAGVTSSTSSLLSTAAAAARSCRAGAEDALGAAAEEDEDEDEEDEEEEEEEEEITATATGTAEDEDEGAETEGVETEEMEGPAVGEATGGGLGMSTCGDVTPDILRLSEIARFSLFWYTATPVALARSWSSLSEAPPPLPRRMISPTLFSATSCRISSRERMGGSFPSWAIVEVLSFSILTTDLFLS